MENTQFLQQKNIAKQDTSPDALRLTFGILFAIPGLVGLIILFFSWFIWMTVGFKADDKFSMLDIVMPGTLLALFSVITVGIILRFAQWKKASAVSLWLAIIATFSAALFIEALADKMGPGWENRFGAFIVAIPVVLVGGLPPFLHWWRQKEQK